MKDVVNNKIASSIKGYSKGLTELLGKMLRYEDKDRIDIQSILKSPLLSKTETMREFKR